MENITIQVDPEIAQAYRDAEPKKTAKNFKVSQCNVKKAVSQKPLLEIMEEASQQAISNEMTPEILESILNDEN